jgi:hypothetical protein
MMRGMILNCGIEGPIVPLVIGALIPMIGGDYLPLFFIMIL